jgi:antitoxin MazE
MTTTIHLSQWGNSLTLAIPKDIVELLKLKADDIVICRIENGKLILEPVNKTLEYTLDQLLAGDIEPSEEVFWGKSEGDEIW